jgi:hypothetical protein
MKFFVAFALSCAVVLGAALSSPISAAACGGTGGTSGCRVATSPFTFEDAVSVIRWLELVIP